MRFPLQIVAFALVLGVSDSIAAGMTAPPRPAPTLPPRKAVLGVSTTEVAFGISIDRFMVPFHAVPLASSASRTVVDNLSPDHMADDARLKDGVSSVENLQQFHLDLPGWNELSRSKQAIYWQTDCGDVLGVDVLRDAGCSRIAVDETRRMRSLCRVIAEGKGAGLVEARFIGGGEYPAIWMVYKRLMGGAFIYTGMLMSCTKQGSSVMWTAVSGEQGTTGVREAIVTTKLLNEGKMTIEEYKSSWAQDPYEPGYRGVDHAALRYRSDDERYDAQFPHHPLSKVRRVLRQVLGSSGLDGTAPCDSAGHR